MAGVAAAQAIICVRTAEKPPTFIIHDHLIQITVISSTKPADLISLGGFEWVKFDVEADNLGIGRQIIKELLTYNDKL